MITRTRTSSRRTPSPLPRRVTDVQLDFAFTRRTHEVRPVLICELRTKNRTNELVYQKSPRGNIAVSKLTNRFTEEETSDEDIFEQNSERRNMYFTATIFLLALNTLRMISQAVPLLDPKSTPRQDVLETIVTSACSSSKGCWEWLPMEEVFKDDLSTIPDNLSIPKVDVRRQTKDLNRVVETWADNVPLFNKEIHQSSLATKQIGNRLSKKDAAMSRSWSAGGMPFSVLYMNSHNPRGNHASTPKQGFRKIGSSTPSTIQPNTRIMVRNRGSMAPRRQYSIIPQLFVSHGWGPFGK